MNNKINKRIPQKTLEDTVTYYRKYFAEDTYAPPHILLDLMQTFDLFKSLARGNIDVDLEIDIPKLENKKLKMRFTLANDN